LCASVCIFVLVVCVCLQVNVNTTKIAERRK